jgi:hypothetical protein
VSRSADAVVVGSVNRDDGGRTLPKGLALAWADMTEAVAASVAPRHGVRDGRRER